MRKLNATELILISNALFEKANGDRAAADSSAVAPHPELAATLRKQADMAEELANVFMCAEAGEVES